MRGEMGWKCWDSRLGRNPHRSVNLEEDHIIGVYPPLSCPNLATLNQCQLGKPRRKFLVPDKKMASKSGSICRLDVLGDVIDIKNIVRIQLKEVNGLLENTRFRFE